MAICKNCGAEVKDDATFCPICGKVLAKKEKMLICEECGSENSVGAQFCSVCGASLAVKVKNPNLESESVAKLKGLLPKIQAVNASFADKFAGASEDDLAKFTYICPVCGKRNSINDQRCVRCGRDRKRSAQLAAKKRIPSFKDAVEVPDRKFAPDLAVYAPIEKEPVVEQTAAVDIEEQIVESAPTDNYEAEKQTAPEEETAPVEETTPIEETAVVDAESIEVAPEEITAEEEIVSEEPAPVEQIAEDDNLFAIPEEAAEEETTEKEVKEPEKESVQAQPIPQTPPYGYPPYYPQEGGQAPYPQYGYPYGYGQMPPIVQPIAFVPYICQEQPLWQTASAEEIAAATLDAYKAEEDK